MKKTLLIILILFFASDVLAQRKVRWQDLSTTLKDSIQNGSVSLGAGDVIWSNLAAAAQDSAISRAKDSLFIAPSGAPVSLRNKASITVSGNADDEISELMGRVEDDSYVRVLPGVYTITNNAETTEGIVFPRKHNVTYDFTGATITLANSENVNMAKVDSAINFTLIGGVWKGNEANQTSGQGIVLYRTTNATLIGVRIDSVWSHAIQPDGAINTVIMGVHGKYSDSGRGVDVEGSPANGIYNQGLLIVGCFFSDYGFSAIKVENSIETVIVGNNIHGREPDGASNNTIVVSNNDGAADTLHSVMIANNFIDGGNAIFIERVNGNVSVTGNELRNTFISISDTVGHVSISDNDIYPGANESRGIDLAPTRIGPVDIKDNLLVGAGTIAEMIEIDGSGKASVVGNRFRNISGEAIEVNTDSTLIHGNIIKSAGGHGGNEKAIGVHSSYNTITDNIFDEFKRNVVMHSADSNLVAYNSFYDKSANADTCIKELGTSDYNRIRNNHIFGVFGQEIVLTGANSKKWANDGLHAVTRENTYDLIMGTSAEVDFRGHVNFDSTATVEDSLWVVATGNGFWSETGGGGEALVISANDFLQFIPDYPTQSTDRIYFAVENGYAYQQTTGSAAAYVKDHWNPTTDSTFELGHVAENSWISLGLEPVCKSQISSTWGNSETFMVLDSNCDGVGDSLIFLYNATKYFRVAIDAIGTY